MDFEAWESSVRRLMDLVGDPNGKQLPADLMTVAFFTYRNRPEAATKRRLEALFAASGRQDLAASSVNLARAPLGPGGPAVSKQLHAVRDLGLDHKQVAWQVSAGHFILTDDSFSEAEREAYLDWVTGVFRGWLKLDGMKFDAIPPAVFSPRDLRRLTFNRNPIRSLPGELFELSTLEELELENCRFNELPGGIGKLTSLRVLRLEGTPLKALPPEIGRCTRLETLQLADTRITSLPEEVGDLAALERLILVGSRIESLPDALFELPRLSTVNVNNTPLARDPAQLARLRAHLESRGK